MTKQTNYTELEWGRILNISTKALHITTAYKKLGAIY